MSTSRILQIPALAGSPGADDEIQRRYQAHQYWNIQDKEAFLRDHGKDVEVIITSAMGGCRKALMDALPNLKAICSWGVGYDTIDVDAARQRGILLSNTPEVLDDCVADLAWGLLIATARRIGHGDRLVRANHWENKTATLPLGTRVSGKKLGVVGLGRIGHAIARRGYGFDMEIGYHNRSKRSDVDYTYFDSLEELAKWCDFMVVATVGGPSTKHLINDKVLRALGSKGMIVNIARGPVIDENAMVKALQDGALGGAGLDVFEHEPKVPDAMKKMDNVVLMPHVASATHETRAQMSRLVLDNVDAYLSTGKVITPIK